MERWDSVALGVSAWLAVACAPQASSSGRGDGDGAGGHGGNGGMAHVTSPDSGGSPSMLPIDPEPAGAANAPECDGQETDLPYQAGDSIIERVLVDEDGTQIPLPIGVFYDAQAQVQCFVGHDAQGNIYCSTQPIGADCTATGGIHGVRLTRETPDATLELAPQILIGEDGSRIATGDFFDNVHQATLRLSLQEGFVSDGNQGLIGSGRLLPLPLSGVRTYKSNPDGSGQLLYGVDDCTLPADTTYVTVTSTRVIDSGKVLEEHTYQTDYEETTAYYYVPGGEGGPGHYEPELAKVLIPTEVPLEMWPQVEQVRLGTGRYRYDAWRVGCFTGRISPWLYDTERDDERCRVFVPVDGTVRCTPMDDLGDIAYADDACTQRVVVPRGSAVRAPRYAYDGVLSSADPDPTVFVVGKQLSENAPVYRLEDTCVPFPAAPTYELLDALPPETFGSLHSEPKP